MRTLIKAIPYASRADVFHILVLPDVHDGNAASDEYLLRRFVDRVRNDEHARWVGAGDYCEFINRREKRFDPLSLPEWLQGAALAKLAQAERAHFLEIVKPIGPQCLGLLCGNHERTMELYNEIDVYGTICEGLGASEDNPLALDMAGFLRLSFRREIGKAKPDTWTYDMYLTHGWWGGQLMGNGVLNLERVFGWAVADCVVAGHDHKAKAFPLARIYPRKNGEVEQRDGWCIGAGTFLGQPRYMEQARPLKRGWIELVIEPDKRTVQVLQ